MTNVRARRHAAGFTLVEIMIGLLIGMIGIVVIMQAFSVSEGYKRTATSGTDAQVNGGIGLYMLERELRLAGFGMTGLLTGASGTTWGGCTSVRVWNDSLAVGRDIPLAPFMINPPGIPAGDANSDVIMVSYSTADSFVVGVGASNASGANSDIVVDMNKDSFRNGDLVVGFQPSVGPGGSNACTLHELTGVGSTNGNGNCANAAGNGFPNHFLQASGTPYANWGMNCQQKTSVFNKAGGVTDSSGSVVAPLNRINGGLLYNLGQTPAFKIYSVRGGNLTTCDLLQATCTNAADYTVVMNDVVSLKAIYGEDFDGVASPTTPLGDGQIDRWSRAALSTPNQVMRVLAAAVAVVARSELKEKPSGGGSTCDATPNANRPDKAITTDWYAGYLSMEAPSGSLAGAAFDLSSTTAANPNPADWMCYRYKLYTTVVPLRNTIWRPM